MIETLNFSPRLKFRAKGSNIISKQKIKLQRTTSLYVRLTIHSKIHKNLLTKVIEEMKIYSIYHFPLVKFAA